MLRNFKPALRIPSFSDPQVVLRLGLGVLLLANLVAAAFAFHIFDAAPDVLDQQLQAAKATRQAALVRLNRSRTLASSVDVGKNEGDKFLSSYMTSRRHTYSTIIGELTDTARIAGMDKAAATIAPLAPIEGSENLDMMSITFNLEGNYIQLMKFVNLLDRSPRFLVIETLTVTPRAKSDTLVVSIKLDTFVKEDTGVKEDADGVS